MELKLGPPRKGRCCGDASSAKVHRMSPRPSYEEGHCLADVVGSGHEETESACKLASSSRTRRTLLLPEGCLWEPEPELEPETNGKPQEAPKFTQLVDSEPESNHRPLRSES